jgi:PAS domain S-box-containing protein
MKIADIMTPDPHVLTADQTVKDAAMLFFREGIDGAPVVNSSGELVGLFGKTQLYEAISRQGLDCLIEELMVRDVATMSPDDDISQWFDSRRGRTPVVQDSKVVGIVTKSDIMSNYNQEISNLTNELETVIASVYNAIVGTDTEARIVLFNDAAERIFDRKKEEVMGLPYSTLFPNSQLAQVLEKGKTVTIDKAEYNGKALICNMSPVKLHDETIGAVSVFQDVSDLDKISRELKYTRELQDWMDAIFEASYDYIFVTDAEGRVERVNQAYYRITGLKPEEIIGRTMDELVDKGFYDRSCTLEVLKTLKRVTLTQKIKTGRTVLVTGNPVFNDQGELTGVITNGRDITELNRLREEVNHVHGISQHYKSELFKIRGLSGCIAESKKMQEIVEMVLQVAKFDSIVLITGESGVGKEIIAHQIYVNSNRKDKDYIRINCAAIPESLLESELFGYEEGAFTGAKKGGKIGIFELASGGTLLLDEIGELPLNIQAKLLRVIQDNEVIRVGGTSPVKIDVRLIAATNRNLQEMVDNNEFREDLFYRLNVIPIRVPPLRERKEEIPTFIEHFLNMFNKKYGLNKRIAPRLIDSLMNYDWPGNIRELRNVIERAMVTSPESVISEIRWGGQDGQEYKFGTDSNIDLRKVVARVERDLIERALGRHGSTRKAADALGISQTTLCRKAKRYDIETS